MPDPAIRVEDLGKKYRIAGSKIGHKTLRETLTDGFMRTVRSAAGRETGRKTDDPTFWALKDVSFAIQPGEVVGVIGRNGAGKSTLLKILSRITEPTEGVAEISGTVGSLLEVGTGFHSELTGRENIYLSGAILGMRAADINRKFEEMVAFAEVERFIDTPIKHYSSGMYLRLAFSVAAHLEPDILLVDEVLAVGDMTFQKKCIGKMQSVSEQGRTVLFVSHNIPVITGLCPRILLLDKGRLIEDGPGEDVVAHYMRDGRETLSERKWPDLASAPGTEVVRMRSARIVTPDRELVDTIDIRCRVGVEFEYQVLKEGHVLVPNFHVYTETGQVAFISLDHDPEWKRRPRPAGIYRSTGWIPGNFLAEGEMTIGVAISTMRPKRVHVSDMAALSFHVVDRVDGTTARGDYTGGFPGAVRPLLEWTTEYQPAE